jgi:enterochelin esterase-like enzyme
VNVVLPDRRITFRIAAPKATEVFLEAQAVLHVVRRAEDPRMPFQKKALEDFQSHKINVTFAAFPGAHEWNVSRHSLADLAPRLFR